VGTRSRNLLRVCRIAFLSALPNFDDRVNRRTDSTQESKGRGEATFKRVCEWISLAIVTALATMAMCVGAAQAGGWIA
jgi:hypothetical protein